MMATIKSKIETTSFNLSDINFSLRSITKYCWMAAGVFFASYLYFVGAITFSVVKQESLAQSIKTIVSETSREELKYLNLQKNLTEGYAKDNGFITAPVVSYAASTRNFAWNTKE